MGDSGTPGRPAIPTFQDTIKIKDRPYDWAVALGNAVGIKRLTVTKGTSINVAR